MVTVQKVIIKRDKLPKELLEIKPMPKIKKMKKMKMQSEVAIYIIKLWQYAKDCQERMKIIKKMENADGQ